MFLQGFSPQIQNSHVDRSEYLVLIPQFDVHSAMLLNILVLNVAVIIFLVLRTDRTPYSSSFPLPSLSADLQLK